MKPAQSVDGGLRRSFVESRPAEMTGTAYQRPRALSQVEGEAYGDWQQQYQHQTHGSQPYHAGPSQSQGSASFRPMMPTSSPPNIYPSAQPHVQYGHQQAGSIQFPSYHANVCASPTIAAPGGSPGSPHQAPSPVGGQFSLSHAAAIPTPVAEISTVPQHSAHPMPPPRARSPRPLSMPSQPHPMNGVSTANQPAPVSPVVPPYPITPSRTVRRSLPQPPGPPSAAPATPPVLQNHAQLPATAAIVEQQQAFTAPNSPAEFRQSNSASSASPSTLSRSETVRKAAEELMSRGPPRRGGRFQRPGGRSPLATSVSSGVAATTPSVSCDVGLKNANVKVERFQSSRSEPVEMHQRRQGQVPGQQRQDQIDALGDSLQLTTLGEEAEPAQTTFALGTPPIPEPVTRPTSRGPRSDVAHSGIPARRRSVQPVADATPSISPSIDTPRGIPSVPSQPSRPMEAPSAAAGLAPAGTIVRILSPPPNAAPPVDPTLAVGAAGPSISVSPAEDHARAMNGKGGSGSDGPAVPVFAFTGPDNDASAEGPPQGPTIHVAQPDETGPSISVSSADEEGDNDSNAVSHHRIPTSSSTASTTTVSLHSGQGQRAKATTTSMVTSLSSITTHPQSSRSSHAHHQHQSASSIAGIVCSAPQCGRYIAGRVISATLGGGPAYYHPDCFSCSHCNEPLEHVAFYDFEGKPYCHFDYYELWAKRCFHCRTPIVDERFIRVDDPELVGATGGQKAHEDHTRYYHDLHFFCANCGDPFLDPKAAGATTASLGHHGGVMDAGDACKPFVVHKGYPYCSPCHDKVHLPKCKGCKGSIRPDEEMLSALKAKWHEACLRCKRCHGSFREDGPGGGRMYVNDHGDVYDEDCYKVWLRSTL